MTPEEKRLAAHYAPSLFERNRGGHDLRLRAGVTNHDFDRAKRELDDRIEIAEARADRHVRNSNNALTPAQVRERNLAAAGIDDLAALTNTLLSADSNDRTKRAARRQLSEYSRRAFGKDIDWDNDGDRKAVNKLLDRDRKVPTADDRAERISDAISDAAATGREEAKSFATRHQIGAYEGDAPQVIARELSRTSGQLAGIAPNVVSMASGVDSINNVLSEHIDNAMKIYTDRGESDIAARAHAINDLQTSYATLSVDEARDMEATLNNGWTISKNEAISLELFKQRNNIGSSTFGNRAVERGLGFNDAAYEAHVGALNPNLLNPAAQNARDMLTAKHEYQVFADNYNVTSAVYRDSCEKFLNDIPAGRKRNEMRDILIASPFNAMLSSGAFINRARIDSVIAMEADSGHPIAPEAVSAMYAIADDVQQQVIANDSGFKSGLMARLSGNIFTSPDDAIDVLGSRDFDYQSYENAIAGSVGDNLSDAQHEISAESAEITRLTSELRENKKDLANARRNYRNAVTSGNAANESYWNSEITRLRNERRIKSSDLTNARTRHSDAVARESDAQSALDTITPNSHPLNSTI